MQSSFRTPETHAAGASLAPRQIAILIAWGVVLWFAAAMFIRFAPDAIFARGPATALAFAAAAPLAWLCIRGTRRIAALRRRQQVAGVALAAAAAMLCDGVAFTWTSIYRPGDRDLAPAAAWILWGVALTILGAFAAERGDAR